MSTKLCRSALMERGRDIKLEEVVINDLRLFDVILVEAQLAKKVTGTISLALAALIVLRFGWGWSRSRSRTGIRRGRGWTRSRTRSGTRRRKFRKLPAACCVGSVLALVAVSISSHLVDLAVGVIVTVAAVIRPFEPGNETHKHKRSWLVQLQDCIVSHVTPMCANKAGMCLTIHLHQAMLLTPCSRRLRHCTHCGTDCSSNHICSRADSDCCCCTCKNDRCDTHTAVHRWRLQRARQVRQRRPSSRIFGGSFEYLCSAE